MLSLCRITCWSHVLVFLAITYYTSYVFSIHQSLLSLSIVPITIYKLMEKAAASEAYQDNTISSEIADQHSSTAEYAKRFSGAVGTWMLSIQTDALKSMLRQQSRTVLDVGGGHGQVAIPLAQCNYCITVLGSSPECSQRLLELINTGAISFKTGNLVNLPFRDRSFDTVTTFRLLSHCTAWPTLIGEMCRVANHSVIFDYPIWFSANFFTPLFFKVKKLIEGNTRSYRIFSKRALEHQFNLHGFTCTAEFKQFFFPMGLHRAIKSKRVSQAIEGLARVLLLTKIFGSPVIIRFERLPHG